MNELNRKLLAECFDALYSDNDLAKAERLFRRQWNLAAKENFKLLESEDEDFQITDMGDDFNQSIADEAGSDDEQKFEQLQIAVDELEDKFPVEMTEEIQEKFDELRNKIDEIKLGAETDEDAAVIIEDLKADFEVAGEMSEDVEALFDEISTGLQGDDSFEEIDVEDEEIEEPSEETKDEEIEEAVEEEPSEETEDEEDLILDAKEKAEELLATLEELDAEEEPSEEDDLTEGWEKAKLPRNKLQNEEEGVKKEGMKFGKAKTIPAGKGLGVSHTNSNGTSADKKVKVCKTENKGAKSWSKLAKPENSAKSGKSVLGN